MTESSNPQRLDARKVSIASSAAGGFAARTLAGEAPYEIPQNMHLCGLFNSAEILPGDGTEYSSQINDGISSYARTSFADLDDRASDVRLSWAKRGPGPEDLFHNIDRDRTGAGGWTLGTGARPDESALILPSRSSRMIFGTPGYTPALGSYDDVPRLLGGGFTGCTLETEVQSDLGVDLFMNISARWLDPYGYYEYRTAYFFLNYYDDLYAIDLNADGQLDSYYASYELEGEYTEPPPIIQERALWNYKTPDSGVPGAPGVGEVQHHTSATSELRVSKTPSSGAADLTVIIVGGTISGAGMLWTITGISDQGSYLIFTVSPASQGSTDAVFEFVFTNPQEDFEPELINPAVPDQSIWLQLALTIDPASDSIYFHVNGKMMLKLDATTGGGGRTISQDFDETINRFETVETDLDREADNTYQGFTRFTHVPLYDGGDYTPRSLLNMPPLTNTQTP